MNNWLLLALAIVAEVVGTSALKASEGFTKLCPSFLVVLGYACAFYFLALTLRTIPVGIAYAIWSGLGIVLISIIAWLFFDQSLDKPAIIGMLFILSGIVIMNVFSKSLTH